MPKPWVVPAGCFLSLTLFGSCLPVPRLLTPLSAQAPSRWVVPTTLGYGALGCGAGALAAQILSEESGDLNEFRGLTSGIGILSGCWLGGRVGLRLGREADSTLARGERLTPGRRRGIQLGVVFLGAAAGTLISFLPRSMRDEDDPGLSVPFALAGAALGLGVAVGVRKYLEPVVEGGPGGGLVLGLRYWIPPSNRRAPSPEMPIPNRRAGDAPGTRGAPGRWR